MVWREVSLEISKVTVNLSIFCPEFPKLWSNNNVHISNKHFYLHGILYIFLPSDGELKNVFFITATAFKFLAVF